MATGECPADPSGNVVAAATEMVPLILAHREEAEQIRHQPRALAEALAAAGLLQMYLPRSMGGPELAPLTVFRAIEVLSKADGSIGWCAMIAIRLSAFMGWLPCDVGRAFCRPTGGFPRAPARCGRGPGLAGRWRLSRARADGISPAASITRNWLLCTCVVMEGDRPRLTAAGTPQTAHDVGPGGARQRSLDTWSVVGMRGTGSHDFVVDDVFVPAAHSFSLTAPPCEAGPLYHPRLFLAVLWTATAANALGIARGAIDAFTAIGGADRFDDVHHVVARPADGAGPHRGSGGDRQRRARLCVRRRGRAWAAVCDGAPDLGARSRRPGWRIVHAMHEAVRAVDLVFHAAGTNAVYSRNPLERYFRDVHVAVQHAAGLPGHYESAGKVLLGLRPSDPGW